MSTLREVAFDLDVAGARQIEAEQIRRWHTWHAAALPNQKKFPSFKEFLGPVKPQASPAQGRRQSMEQQIAIARQWAAVDKARTIRGK